ncbi:DUF2336 domain-containing protein [Polycladidibacter stylochi]|uniref:DUF2336 domain-containing protein n=1 Tax=Polycladidibacter stylochi TaxID=1807766 RepID=UPI0008356988|nr:DUF2336 domain-containing protein [Pseudovibrio stylochi]
MASSVSSEMIDFQSLALDGDNERRGELAKQVALLFSKTWERCSDEQIEIYDSVMIRLSEMVELQARVYMAECLCELECAPRGTLRRLAGDTIEVAEPILEKSKVLHEQDLIELADNLGDLHRLAIAKRDSLSEAITQVLIDRGNKHVRYQVASNGGALINRQSLDILMHDAQSDEIMQTYLGSREDLADEQIEELIGFASEKVRLKLIEEGCVDEVSRLSQAARIAAQKLSHDYWLSRYDFEGAADKVLSIAREGKLDAFVMRQFAEEECFPEAVAGFALLAEVSYENAKRWMVQNDTKQFVTVCRALGFNLMTLQALLKIGPWRYKLTPQERQSAITEFQRLDLLQAREALSKWKDS